MPFSVFYDFSGCSKIPTITSCILKDNTNIDLSGGILV